MKVRQIELEIPDDVGRTHTLFIEVNRETIDLQLVQGQGDRRRIVIPRKLLIEIFHAHGTVKGKR